MSSSGAYTFGPSLGELVLNAYSRIGKARTDLMQEHMVTARLEANLLLQAWSNLGVNLWEIDLQTLPLVSGTATYTLVEQTVSVLDAYIETTSGSSVTGRIIFPVSRSDYAAYPDKVTSGTPTVFWFNRQITPTLTLWQPPDATTAASSVLKYYRMRAVQDANIGGGETPDLPDRFTDAFTAGLAHRLSRHYAQPLEIQRKQDAVEAWQQAAAADIEWGPISVAPQLGGYFR